MNIRLIQKALKAREIEDPKKRMEEVEKIIEEQRKEDQKACPLNKLFNEHPLLSKLNN